MAAAQRRQSLAREAARWRQTSAREPRGGTAVNRAIVSCEFLHYTASSSRRISARSASLNPAHTFGVFASQ